MIFYFDKELLSDLRYMEYISFVFLRDANISQLQLIFEVMQSIFS